MCKLSSDLHTNTMASVHITYNIICIIIYVYTYTHTGVGVNKCETFKIKVFIQAQSKVLKASALNLQKGTRFL